VFSKTELLASSVLYENNSRRIKTFVMRFNCCKN